MVSNTVLQAWWGDQCRRAYGRRAAPEINESAARPPGRWCRQPDTPSAPCASTECEAARKAKRPINKYVVMFLATVAAWLAGDHNSGKACGRVTKVCVRAKLSEDKTEYELSTLLDSLSL